MRKFVLVVFIGMVLALDVFGIAKDIKEAFEKEQKDPLDGVATIVYVEE